MCRSVNLSVVWKDSWYVFVSIVWKFKGKKVFAAKICSLLNNLTNCWLFMNVIKLIFRLLPARRFRQIESWYILSLPHLRCWQKWLALSLEPNEYEVNWKVYCLESIRRAVTWEDMAETTKTSSTEIHSWWLCSLFASYIGISVIEYNRWIWKHQFIIYD